MLNKLKMSYIYMYNHNNDMLVKIIILESNIIIRKITHIIFFLFFKNFFINIDR